MGKPLTLDPTAQESPAEIAAIQAELEQCMIEWEQLKQQLLDDKREIARLRAQTRAKLERMEEQIKRF